MRRAQMRLLIVMLAVTMLVVLAHAPSEAQISLDQYQKTIETLFSDWNAHKPQSRSALSKAIENSVKIQLGPPPQRFYQDREWAQDIFARIPDKIEPQLRIDDDAFKRYRGFPESRHAAYAKLFPPDVVGGDLTAKFYLFMASAQESAVKRKAQKIDFPDLRVAMFFWQSGVWPFCY